MRMTTGLDRKKARAHLENFDLRALFIEELGWDYGGGDIEIRVADRSFALRAIAHKRGMIAYQYISDSAATFPDHVTRQKIEKSVSKTAREHIIVYASPDNKAQYWQWVKRESGRPDQSRLHIYHREQPGEALIQKLEYLVFSLEEEDDLTIVDVSGRVRAAFDVERVTKRFYDRFKKEHDTFLRFIGGVEALSDREWYASLMLNRMMFIYFIQKRGFLDGDVDYLRNRLESMQKEHGKDRFQRFYRLFLLRLFHEGLSQPAEDHDPELSRLLGSVPYLNGGLFGVHELERENEDIIIPDEAFQRIFDFFDAYQWHLDDRPLHDDTEINPDVLGYIFEKYINQKQMGAYYTKEDITGYISRNTVIPFLWDRARIECPIALDPGGGVWRLLSDDPDRYFYESVRHGITYDINEEKDLAETRELPHDIAAGLVDLAARTKWNTPAPDDYALPTETWREHVARRQHYEEVHAKLASGEIDSINELITHNLDIEKFVQDVISSSEGPELIRAFWKAITRVSVLDPTCGSGAFLFAALNVLEPIYVTCLDVMRGFLDDLERSDLTHHAETMGDFRKVIENVTAHASEPYFILKSIIVDNLYGVDIMEEAVEICKLRLFLKLVSQLENYNQIEPLPDIDFNIRAGNTLVGFLSLEEIKQALIDDLLQRELTLPDIEKRAELADRAFQKFREMQTGHGMDAGTFAGAKTELRERLNNLRDELNRYLADDYGVRTDNPTAYEQWIDSHQPFHWFVEFHGIMHDGGFDVIIGNPPYVETARVSREYSLERHELVRTGNLYSICMERFIKLLGSNQRYGVIVPISAVSTPRMLPLMRFITSRSSVHISNYAVRPAKLFVGVDMNLTIFIGTTSENQDRYKIFTTNYRRWNENSRGHLFGTISYIESFFSEPLAAISKIGSCAELIILKKLMSHEPLERLRINGADDPIYYHSGGRYFRKCIRRQLSNEYKELSLRSGAADPILCLLSSSLYYWFWIIFSDCYHVTRLDINTIPVPDSLVHDTRLNRLSDTLVDDLEKNAEVRMRRRADGRRQEEVNFHVGKSKSLIDQIDHIIAEHYGLSELELDFIINYDIKYRMGRAGLE
jgi:hypothetical protein